MDARKPHPLVEEQNGNQQKRRLERKHGPTGRYAATRLILRATLDHQQQPPRIPSDSQRTEQPAAPPRHPCSAGADAQPSPVLPLRISPAKISCGTSLSSEQDWACCRTRFAVSTTTAPVDHHGLDRKLRRTGGAHWRLRLPCHSFPKAAERPLANSGTSTCSRCSAQAGFRARSYTANSSRHPKQLRLARLLLYSRQFERSREAHVQQRLLLLSDGFDKLLDAPVDVDEQLIKFHDIV